MPSQEVLIPIAARRPAHARAAAKARRSSKPVVGLLNNSKPNVAFFLEAVEGQLRAQPGGYEILNVVKPRSAAPCPDIDLLADRCDFVINGVADCGSCTAWSVHDAIELERRGVATVTVVTDAFVELSTKVSVAMGYPAMRTWVIPHPLGDLRRDDVAERGRTAFPGVMDALLAARPADEAAPAADVGTVAVSGSYEEVNDEFYARGWTDGLPIVPPTAERIERFLTAAGRESESVVADVPPMNGAATVEKIAVNAVMAGCRPEYLPVVIAAVAAVCRPEFNLLPMQATTNPVTPMIIVNGPVVGRLGLNSRSNALGQGWRSNATIGRALRLVLTNIGGGIPGKTDKACQGQPGKYTFCIAENADASPWEPFHVERGFAAEDSTVSVLGVTGTQDIIHYARTSAAEVLKTIIHAIPREGYKNLYSGGEPLVVFGPEQAAVLGCTTACRTWFSPTTRLMWPLPLVSSKRRTLPRAKCRTSPLLNLECCFARQINEELSPRCGISL